MSTESIRGAIKRGELRAEVVVINNRRVFRIYHDWFCAYLRAIGWTRIPK